MENRKMCPDLVVLGHYELLQIFEYLNFEDLSSAMQVSRFWWNAAAREKQRRLKPPYLFLTDLSEGVEDNSYNLLTDSSEALEDYEAMLTHMPFKPALGVRFSDALNKRQIGCHNDDDPESYDLITVVGLDPIFDEKQIKGIKTGRPAMACLFLPEIPGVTIKMFSSDTFNANTFRGIELPSHDDMRCIVFFAVNILQWMNIASDVLCQYMRRNESIAIWGGLARHLTVCKGGGSRRTCYDSTPMAGFFISGKNISTWSVVIDDECETKEQIEEKLSNFKANVTLQSYSVGLIFSCSSRDTYRTSEKYVEARIFRHLFPAVPLVGGFGKSGFGRTNVAGVTSELESLNEWSSTMFMIISY